MAQIIVGTDGLCMCNCGTKCVCDITNSGIGPRCTEEMLINAGHQPIKLHSKADEKAMHAYTLIDGKEKRITVNCIEVPLKDVPNKILYIDESLRHIPKETR